MLFCFALHIILLTVFFSNRLAFVSDMKSARAKYQQHGDILAREHFGRGRFCPVHLGLGDIFTRDNFGRGLFCLGHFGRGRFCRGHFYLGDILVGDFFAGDILAMGYFCGGPFCEDIIAGDIFRGH